MSDVPETKSMQLLLAEQAASMAQSLQQTVQILTAAGLNDKAEKVVDQLIKLNGRFTWLLRTDHDYWEAKRAAELEQQLVDQHLGGIIEVHNLSTPPAIPGQLFPIH